MPLSETAKKYAQAVYKEKAEKLSEDYEGTVQLAQRYIEDEAFWQSTVGQRFIETKAQVLSGQVRAKADALESAYAKDNKVVDAAALEEIMHELEDQAQTVSRALITFMQQKHDSRAQRTGTVDLDLTVRLNELTRSTGELMSATLSEIRSSLQRKVYGLRK
jgi:hypothetical protein